MNILRGMLISLLSSKSNFWQSSSFVSVFLYLHIPTVDFALEAHFSLISFRASLALVWHLPSLCFPWPKMNWWSLYVVVEAMLTLAILKLSHSTWSYDFLWCIYFDWHVRTCSSIVYLWFPGTLICGWPKWNVWCILNRRNFKGNTGGNFLYFVLTWAKPSPISTQPGPIWPSPSFVWPVSTWRDQFGLVWMVSPAKGSVQSSSFGLQFRFWLVAWFGCWPLFDWCFCWSLNRVSLCSLDFAVVALVLFAQ